MQYKLLFLGDTSVGKTSLLIRYIDNKYDGDGLPTLGVDVRYKFVELENKKNKSWYMGYSWPRKIQEYNKKLL